MSHDLGAIVATMIMKHFPGMPAVHVAWVVPAKARPEYWCADDDWGCHARVNGEHFIGLAPELARAPRYVVRYMIMHELLHIALPPRGRLAHHRAFRVAERLWPDYIRANRWLDAHA